LVTTSRNPSDKLKKFHKEISSIFPNSASINRGAYKIKDIFEIAKDKDFSDIVFIHEYKGVPNGLVISHLPIGPTIYIGLTNVVMRHDVEDSKDKISLAYPHLIFNNFN
jgi:U3 small nucleolar ribonucleoprotein protein IMP4